jgi:prolyl oligopeptidase
LRPFVLRPLAAIIAAGSVLAASPAFAIAPQDGATEAPEAVFYPQTKRGEVIDEQFGVKVADPYRWLENDVRNDPEVRDWVRAQNKVTDAFLAGLPEREAFKARITQLYDYERFSIPRKEAGRYFYMRNDGLQNQSVLYVRESLTAKPRMLIDPNTWSADGATALGEWAASDQGDTVAYTIQDGGTDWRTVRLLDVATGQPLADEVKWVKFSSIAWAKDGSGFFYSRFPEPEESEAFQALNENHQVYFHRIGTPQSDDVLMFATPDRPELNNWVQVSDDGNWLIIYSSSGTDSRYEVSLVDLKRPGSKPRVLIPGFDNNWSYIGNRGSSFYFITDSQAPRQRVVSIDIAQASPEPRTVIAEDEATLRSADLVGGRIIANYLKDAKSDVRVHSLGGALERTIELPGIGTASGFTGEFDDSETFFAFTSFNRPTTIYRYDVSSGEVAVWEEPKVVFNPADYEVNQVFYNSKDGTRVPMFIVRKAGSTGPAPTLLYGYGGFDISVTPTFSPTRMAWIEKGGTYAVANIRGGGEYGKEWHDAGRLENKQNTFDDFIAAGEYLKASGITTANGLAIEGRSNGGLLVGAVVNQRPDLIDAGHAAVGVMDMLRFDRFTAGRYWVDDYGHPDREADFRTLLAYSPYHNIRPGVDYPPVLVTTADTDDRVVPGHSFKYVAALQAANPSARLNPARPHLIRIETRAGHGSGKPTDKVIEEAADVYAFLARFTGL